MGQIFYCNPKSVSGLNCNRNESFCFSSYYKKSGRIYGCNTQCFWRFEIIHKICDLLSHLCFSNDYSSSRISTIKIFFQQKYDCLTDWHTEKMLSHLKTSSMENITRAVKFSGAIFMILVTTKLPANWCQK